MQVQRTRCLMHRGNFVKLSGVEHRICKRNRSYMKLLGPFKGYCKWNGFTDLQCAREGAEKIKEIKKSQNPISHPKVVPAQIKLLCLMSWESWSCILLLCDSCDLCGCLLEHEQKTVQILKQILPSVLAAMLAPKLSRWIQILSVFEAFQFYLYFWQKLR